MKPKDFAINNVLRQQAALQGVVDTIQKSSSWMALEQIRAEVSSIPMVQLKQELDQMKHLRPYFDAALSIQRQVEAIYGPLEDITKEMTSITMEWAAALQTSKALQAIPQFEFVELKKIKKIVQDYFSSESSEFSDISAKELQDYCAKEKITPDTVTEAVGIICAEAAEENLTIPDRIDKVKRTNWFFALTIILMILSFLGKPAIDHLKDDVLESLGVTQFWEQSGIYEWLDELFNMSREDGAVSEDEAKASVDVHNGNVSKEKRNELLTKISAIRTYIAAAPQDENTGNLMIFLSDLEKELGTKKYGLVFEEHREAIDEVLEDYTPVLTEEPELFIDKDGEMNFLLEGDNLAALRLLEKTHRGRIDLIYIDPPYNTGNKDFVYDDCFVDAQDTFRHSKWLSFMSKRLELAKHLLSERGVIFISIDDREQAGLKLLCDSIFDESCFVADISWQRTYSMRNDSHGIPSEVEHILVYSKEGDWNPNKLPRTEAMNAKYKNPDNDPLGPWQNTTAFAPGAVTHQGMVYAIQHPFTGKMIYPTKAACWRYQQDQMLEYMRGWCDYELQDLDDIHERALVCGLPDKEIRTGVKGIVLSASLEESRAKAMAVYKRGQWPRFFFTAGGKGGIRRKTYMENVGGRPATNYWPFSETGHTDEAKKELMSTFGGEAPFSTPKPVRLIDRVITIASQPDSIILDFFAGSGTTGHAVLSHNARDVGSRRKFILCTNNENGICENVTYERIKRVIDREGYEASLKYYRIDYVPINEQLYYEYADELLRHVRELVELENGINFIENAEIAIVLTDEELTDFIARSEAFSKCHTLYLGHDILPTGEQDAAIKQRSIRVNIIPDYYYRELEG